MNLSVIKSEIGCPLPTRRGLNRVQVADYIGVGTSKFDTLVIDGRMPKPKQVDGRRVWDKRAVDLAFDALQGGDDSDENEWDA